VPRRVSLPGADELFRTTGGMALQSSTPRQHSGTEPAPQVSERLRPATAPAGDDSDADQEPAADSGREAGPGAAESANSGPATADSAHSGMDTGAARPPVRSEHQSSATIPAPGGPGAEHARSAGPDSQSPPAQRRPPQEMAEPPRRRERRVAPNRRPSGRERHDEKITVYVSAEELMDLEHARLVLRGEHGLAVDRGRIVREAVAVVLADLESRGDASILVRRLRGR
jgi:hypothetical protein